MVTKASIDGHKSEDGLCTLFSRKHEPPCPLPLHLCSLGIFVTSAV